MTQRCPRVTVCIPTYNRGRCLRQALDSVFGQTFEDYLVLVVDDASSDETADVIASYRDQRLRYYRNPTNLGMVRNWNACLARAPESRYLARLDDDDLYQPDLLASAVAALESEPRAAFAYAAAETIREDGATVAVRRSLVGSRTLSPRAAFDHLLVCNTVPTPTVVLRHAALQQVGPYDPAAGWCADWEMWLRLASRFPIVYLDRVLARYRISVDSSSTRSWADGSAVASMKYTLRTALGAVPPQARPRWARLRQAHRAIALEELGLAFRQLYAGREREFRATVCSALAYAPEVMLGRAGTAALLLTLASLFGQQGPRLVWTLRDSLLTPVVPR